MFIIDDLIFIAYQAAHTQMQFIGGVPAPQQGELAKSYLRQLVSPLNSTKNCMYEGVVVPYAAQSEKSGNNPERALLIYKRQSTRPRKRFSTSAKPRSRGLM